MVKALIYSSKEIYDNSSFEGRAEAHVIAYRDEHEYVILKNRTSLYIRERTVHYMLEDVLARAEKAEWKRELDSHKLTESYKGHPYTTLMKNEL